MYSRKIINIFSICEVSRLVENFNTGIDSDTINVINVKLCMIVILIELYLFISLSSTLTIFHGDTNIEQF